MPALTRLAAALGFLAALLVPAQAAPALDHLAAQSFEDDGPWAGISSVANAGGFACAPAARTADDAAHSGANVLASSCPDITIAFSAPQAYVTLWAKTDTGGAVTMSAGSDGTPVRGTGDKGQWIPLTLPVTDQATISQVVVHAEGSRAHLSIDDLTFSATAQPDTAIGSGPAAVTNDARATFAFDSSVAGSTFSCALDGAAATACTSGMAYGPLADGDHTFTVVATDPFGHADASPAVHRWRVDRTGPRTSITDGPAGSTTSRSARVTFSSSDPDVRGFECSLDDAPFAACTSPASYDDLPRGERRIRVRATDTLGNVEATPASISWTIERPSRRAAKPKLDGSGTPSGESAIQPACSASANPGVPDRDRDGLLDRCDRLPSANRPVMAGAGARVRVTDGEVWLKLAPGATASRVVARSASDRDGWVPLKGAAVIPMGSRVDARDGTLQLDTAKTNRRSSAVQRARFAAGIFQIRQARARRARRASRAAVVDLHLQTPPDAADACSGRSADDVVRTLSASVAGRYRMWGAVSTAKVDGRATWTVSDRCDGTLTTVARGRASVHDLRGSGTSLLRSGASKLVAAPLFVSLKGRS